MENMIYPVRIDSGARRCQMDKRILEKERVKAAIAKAWIALLKEKSFSEIKVTDLVKRAGVTRQSYYRNFESMEDVAKEYMSEIQQDTHGKRTLYK